YDVEDANEAHVQRASGRTADGGREYAADGEPEPSVELARAVQLSSSRSGAVRLRAGAASPLSSSPPDFPPPGSRWRRALGRVLRTVGAAVLVFAAYPGLVYGIAWLLGFRPSLLQLAGLTVAAVIGAVIVVVSSLLLSRPVRRRLRQAFALAVS